MPVNRSETFVAKLCDRSFLVPWAFLNPATSDGRELSDAAVVFEDTIILLSVKEYTPQTLEPLYIARDRWARKAIDASLRQLRGAHRRLTKVEELLEPSTGRAVTLPALTNRRVHLLSVSLGGAGIGRFGSRSTSEVFVHVFDEVSFVPHFALLSTVVEFVAYLEHREQHSTIDIEVQEEDWLGSYLESRHFAVPGRFEPEAGSLIRYLGSPQFRLAVEHDPPSYFWDRSILHLWTQRRAFVAGGGTVGGRDLAPSADIMDSVLRQTSIHSRAERRLLGGASLDFFADEGETVARVLKTKTGPVYILQRLQGRDRIESNHVELVARCIYIQECVLPDRNLVGIAATDDFGTLSPDAVILLCYLEGAVGTEAMREQAEALARDLRLFQQVRTLDVPSEELGLPPTKR